MQRRALGQTGIDVSVLGLGTGGLGSADVAESDFAKVLHRALDLGVNLVDTARSYGLAEARLGRHLGARRRDVVLCTKGGYMVEGAPDWTPEAITYGIHRALRQLKTDYLDIFLLHSCPLEVLQRDELLDALTQAKEAGKIREAGYSGEGAALEWALRSGRFTVLECSVNVVDQHSLGSGMVAEAQERGLGILAKRPLANACFTYSISPGSNDVGIYWGRMQKLKVDPGRLGWAELALRFAAFAPGVSSAIAGMRTIPHLEANAAALVSGPLEAPLAASIRQAFTSAGASWDGLI